MKAIKILSEYPSMIESYVVYPKEFVREAIEEVKQLQKNNISMVMQIADQHNRIATLQANKSCSGCYYMTWGECQLSARLQPCNRSPEEAVDRYTKEPLR